MFTGLVNGTGKVLGLRRREGGAVLTVETDQSGIREGESIAVNGVCQTVTGVEGSTFSSDILPETLRVTNLGSLRPRALVNIERALKAEDRLGGHIVNGHVDGVGLIRAVSRNPFRIEISAGREISQYLVPKGSVAVDGVSLTVGPRPAAGRFEVFIIPHTWKSTNLREAAVGKKVNIEIDLFAKYVRKFVQR